MATVPAWFQTLSVGRGPSADNVVPPTPVTSGWLAGSSTAGWVWGSCPEVLQSCAPLSPPAATMVWPWTAAWANRLASACASVAPRAASHSPQETLTTCARS